MSIDPNPSESNATKVPTRTRLAAFPRLAITTSAALTILVVGVAVGAVAMKHEHGWRMATYTPIATTAISTIPEWSTVEIKGQVAEIFGNKFVVQDASGGALVETGRQDEGVALVAKDETVSVQGRFEHGFLHAGYIVHADGKILGLDVPPGPPRHGLHGPLEWLQGPPGESTSPTPRTGPAG
jgi:hypothetical protein